MDQVNFCGRQPLTNLKGYEADHILSNFLKTDFRSISLVHSRILCLIYAYTYKYNIHSHMCETWFTLICNRKRENILLRKIWNYRRLRTWNDVSAREAFWVKETDTWSTAKRHPTLWKTFCKTDFTWWN